jgi:hypothetical protein
MAACKTYWAPASSALFTKSGWVILMRTKGDTFKAAIAPIALCIASSEMWPCSQSMMIPYSVVSTDMLKTRNIHTSIPVCDTICAVLSDGSPRKVMIGRPSPWSSFKSRSRGLWTFVVHADGNASGDLTVMLAELVECLQESLWRTDRIEHNMMKNPVQFLTVP